MFFLDANIPMYAAGTESRYKAACVAILEAAATGDLEAVCDTEILQEILYRYTHLGVHTAGIRVARDTIQAVPTVLPVFARDVERAMILMEQNSRLHSRDALHAAVMLNNGIQEIITADREFDVLRGMVTRHDPVAFARRLRG
ncbi:MAG: type II toxin-antitoxin system VapC family toxin [bacterium]